MPEPIRCGLLGINHSHALSVLRMLQRLPDYEVVGVCEPDEAVRADFEGRIEGAPWLTREQLLGDETVRMVAIESDVPRLLSLAQEAVDAGKHIHLDKPAGTSLPDFRRLLDTAEASDLIIAMGYMFRYNPGFDLIRRAHQEGWLGEVYSIEASMCTDLPAPRRDRINFHDGGIMLELGCHLIDMIVLLLGPPQRVVPVLRSDGHFDDGLSDNTHALFEYPHGMVMLSVAAMEPQAFATRRFKISGQHGTAVLSPLEPPELRLSLRHDAGDFEAGVHTPEVPNRPRHEGDLIELAQCIRGEHEFPYSKTHDYNVQRTVLEASTRRKIIVP